MYLILDNGVEKDYLEQLLSISKRKKRNKGVIQSRKRKQ
jgi:hypothetical protein